MRAERFERRKRLAKEVSIIVVEVERPKLTDTLTDEAGAYGTQWPQPERTAQHRHHTARHPCVCRCPTRCTRADSQLSINVLRWS